MARTYSKAKGQSGSTRPSNPQPKSWMSYKSNEIEALVAKLAKEKLTASQIGMKLRDSYGVPSVKVATKKSISEILDEKKLAKTIPQDLIDCIAKAIQIQKHLDENKQDKTARRGLRLAQSRIGRLVKYYKRIEKLDKNWTFDPEKAGMYLE
ncbi:MAG TPA: 30S ribosomal protein S15 [Acidobacteriota bacterium]|nr:30S ribosomal protein S15 [Acidobacteriota bacterium]